MAQNSSLNGTNRVAPNDPCVVRIQPVDATQYYSLSEERSVDHEAKNTDKLLSVLAS